MGTDTRLVTARQRGEYNTLGSGSCSTAAIVGGSTSRSTKYWKRGTPHSSLVCPIFQRQRATGDGGNLVVASTEASLSHSFSLNEALTSLLERIVCDDALDDAIEHREVDNNTHSLNNGHLFRLTLRVRPELVSPISRDNLQLEDITRSRQDYSREREKLQTSGRRRFPRPEAV